MEALAWRVQFKPFLTDSQGDIVLAVAMGVGGFCNVLYDLEHGMLAWVLLSDFFSQVFFELVNLGDVRSFLFLLFSRDKELFVFDDAVDDQRDLLHQHGIGYLDSDSAFFVCTFP